MALTILGIYQIVRKHMQFMYLSKQSHIVSDCSEYFNHTYTLSCYYGYDIV